MVTCSTLHSCLTARMVHATYSFTTHLTCTSTNQAIHLSSHLTMHENLCSATCLTTWVSLSTSQVQCYTCDNTSHCTGQTYLPHTCLHGSHCKLGSISATFIHTSHVTPAHNALDSFLPHLAAQTTQDQLWFLDKHARTLPVALAVPQCQCHMCACVMQ